MAERLTQELGRPPTFKEVLGTAELSDTNRNTVQTQYYNWKSENHPSRNPVQSRQDQPLTCPAPAPTEVDDGDPKWSSLLKNGFTYVSDWQVASHGGLSLDRPIPDQPGLYAFVLEDEVVYVGVTHRTLHARMGDYRRGHALQRTSNRLNDMIQAELEQGRCVRVLVATPEDTTWNGLPCNTAAGVEVGLIALFKPRWNKRGAS